MTFECGKSDFIIAYTPKAEAAPAAVIAKINGIFALALADEPAADQDRDLVEISSVNGVVTLDLAKVDPDGDIFIIFPEGTSGNFEVTCKVTASEPPVSEAHQPDYGGSGDEEYSAPSVSTPSVAAADPVVNSDGSVTFTVSTSEVWWAQFSVNAYLGADDLKPENIITFTCANSEFKIAYIDKADEWTTVDSVNGIIALDLANVNLGADISVVFSTGSAGKFNVSWTVESTIGDEDTPLDSAPPVVDGSSATFAVTEDSVWWAQFSINDYLDPDDLVSSNIMTFTCADAEFKIAYTNNDGEWTTIDSVDGILALDLSAVNLGADISVVFYSGNAGDFTVSWTAAPNPDYQPGSDAETQPGTDAEPAAPAEPVMTGESSATFTVNEDSVWWAQFSVLAYLDPDALQAGNTVTFTCADDAFLIAYISLTDEWTTIEAVNHAFFPAR